MGTQLISGAQQILMVLGDQGAREPRTMKCTKASKKTHFLLHFFGNLPLCNMCKFCHLLHILRKNFATYVSLCKYCS